MLIWSAILGRRWTGLFVTVGVSSLEKAGKVDQVVRLSPSEEKESQVEVLSAK